MRISDWSSDVCSSDLGVAGISRCTCRSGAGRHRHGQRPRLRRVAHAEVRAALVADLQRDLAAVGRLHRHAAGQALAAGLDVGRSEEHTSELQSLMRISYAVFCLKKKQINIT